MNTLLQATMPHLIAAPILLPLATAGLMLFFGEKRRALKAVLNLLSCLAALCIAMALLVWTKNQSSPAALGVYLPGNWDMPFGIVLVLDRLSALMLFISAVVALASVLFALARWHKAGVHFHPLFQIQLMGLNGAFLTGDLFNLFVFFEVLLAASYGLLLHGSGPARVQAGLHYVAINLVASSLFLVGAALIYGVTGTLNLADLAVKIPLAAVADQPLLHAGAAILGLAFLTKAAMWPLNFWLVPAYTAASTPVSALFAMLTKVGFYVVLRLSTLLFPAGAAASAGFGSDWLLYGGMATLAVGAIGMLAAQRPARLASYAAIVSAGTLLAIVGYAQPSVTGGALFYLPSSTLAVAAFFLLTELVERSRDLDPQTQRAPEDEEDHLPFALADLDIVDAGGVNLDEKEEALVGQIIPAATAFLGLAFVCCTLLIAGLPPLSGFIGKFAILTALLNPGGLGNPLGNTASPTAWVLVALIIGSGLLALVALSRAGIRFFWAPQGRAAPRLRVVECLPIVGLIVLCVAFTVRADAVMRYASATAQALYTPTLYINAVLTARPIPSSMGQQGNAP
ncbi:MAG TPA: monovalent cation/H+ antiporter subunit D [Burkholderiaceae bacterium]